MGKTKEINKIEYWTHVVEDEDIVTKNADKEGWLIHYKLYVNDVGGNSFDACSEDTPIADWETVAEEAMKLRFQIEFATRGTVGPEGAMILGLNLDAKRETWDNGNVRCGPWNIPAPNVASYRIDLVVLEPIVV